uniref:Uncharacterized protein n=1 Tax=Anguilla anguilla TaxID=7936 RepID=A0A0E9XXL0_ANGAN
MLCEHLVKLFESRLYKYLNTCKVLATHWNTIDQIANFCLLLESSSTIMM